MEIKNHAQTTLADWVEWHTQQGGTTAREAEKRKTGVDRSGDGKIVRSIEVDERGRRARRARLPGSQAPAHAVGLCQRMVDE